MRSFKRIAIVGTGISGLMAAYLLHPKYEVTLFEQGNYVGGHTHTVLVPENNKRYAIDTGFIVFNPKTYPNFVRLLHQLKVPIQKSNMSFSFSSDQLGLSYSGDSLRGLFAQKKNLLNLKFYRLIKDIACFNKVARVFIQKPDSHVRLVDWIRGKNYGNYFKAGYLKPLASAIWSMPAEKVLDMPAKFMLDFYANHGLLDLINKEKWYVIQGGSSNYVQKMTAAFADKIHLNEKVLCVKRQDTCVTVVTDRRVATFDAIVMACHSDQALALLDHPTETEVQILEAIPYVQNKAVLHTDIQALPKRKSAWASWNYLQDRTGRASLTYYMNKLQAIKSDTHFCVSINPPPIQADKIIKTCTYAHPLYSLAGIAAKLHHHLINAKNRTFYVGAYWGYGFHEDGVLSSLKALYTLGVSL